MPQDGFVRARRPEHKQQRRQAILDAARTLGMESGVREVTLRGVALAVGLAKSNVARYFGTREEIFLELAAEAWGEWERALTERLEGIERLGDAGRPGGGGRSADVGQLADGGRFADGGRSADAELPPVVAELPPVTEQHPAAERLADVRTGEAVVAAVAETLADRPFLCDLISQTSTTLEHNISLEAARAFKREALAVVGRLGARVGHAHPALTESEGGELIAAAAALAGMLHPVAAPPPVMRELYAQEPDLAAACPQLLPTLRRSLAALAAGLPTLR
ncbi:MAG TPA: TetR/AcrR family transcriptional regulator [Streptomyces sp.]|nr:TetR/AcrR family transcriptional regulator [Streptomyces sp.]